VNNTAFLNPRSEIMNLWTLIRKSLFHYWQIHLAMALAVAVTTAVLTGALTVGDSMRGSLRDLTFNRLGPIDHVILSRTFFDDVAVNQWTKSTPFQNAFSSAVSTIHFPSATLEKSNKEAIAEAPGKSSASRAIVQDWASVALWGMTPELANKNWSDEKIIAPDSNEIIVNQTAAGQLGLTNADIGQLFSLRLGKPSDVPTESFIASKDDTVASILRLKLVKIIPDTGLGRISLIPSTEVPAVAYLELDTLRKAIPDASQDARKEAKLLNTILVFGESIKTPVSIKLSQEAIAAFAPSIADVGLKITHVQQTYPSLDDSKSTDSQTDAGKKSTTDNELKVATIFDYYSISSNRLLIDSGQQSAVERALEGLPQQTVLTYLANHISLTDNSVAPNETEDSGIPFSMLTAFDLNADFPLENLQGQTIAALKDNEIVLGQWAAEDLGAKIGQTIQVKFYEPETIDGQEIERTVDLNLVDIAKATVPSEPYQSRGRRVTPAQFKTAPTTANDPWLTPEVPGITDAASIDAWDLPFDTSSSLRSKDDQYWEYYRTTPKAFIASSTGLKLWKNRFGSYTSFRVPGDATSGDQLRQKLAAAIPGNLDELGFQVIPAKLQGLAGSQGSTPFDVLFLMFSMFVIAASLMLLALFFRLGMQQRSKELGLWLAIGFDEFTARSIWIKESIASTIIGMIVGTILGIAYASVITLLMRTAWVGAVASPFLQLHWSWLSIGMGGIGSLAVCLGVVWLSVKQATKTSTRSLLSGGWNDNQSAAQKPKWWHATYTRISMIGFATIASLAGFFAAGDAQAVAFLAGGFFALMAALTTIYDRLVQQQAHDNFSWSVVDQLNLARQPLRSLIIIGLVGLATFLIMAVSAFRLSPSIRGTAGFDLVVTTDLGILKDLGQSTTRNELISAGEVEATSPQESTQSELKLFGFRFHDGEHASCNNPFQARQPQVLGASQAFIDRFNSQEVPSFAWAGTTAMTQQAAINPWRLLDDSAAQNFSNTEDAKQPISVIIDKNTAWYALKVYLPGTKFTIDFPDAGPVEFRLVGLLDNSLLQGALIVGPNDFLKVFPDQVGNRYFLATAQSDAAQTEFRKLGASLKSYGWQAKSADNELANYMAVQNTYLSAFQSLGSLGLLLGTIGLVVAQFRSMLERKREFALLQAIGFDRRRIQGLISRETVRLIILGFLSGIAGATVCVLPHWLTGSASVPILGLSIALISILGVGMLASLMIGKVVLRGQLITLLRND